MKYLLKTLALSTLSGFVLIACSSDDDSGSSEGSGLANIQNATEDQPIALNVLDSGIIIEGAEKIEGDAPVPNSQLEFTLSNTSQEAFQESGLNIEFSSQESFAGAFIQFKDVDGNKSGNYFDIPAAAFNTEENFGRKNLISRKSISSIANVFNVDITPEEPTNTINIDFNAIPAGTFCYDICLYDDENNIFVVQEVCVTVEAWGGNDAIVGNWVFDRAEGGFFDDDFILTCDNEETISVREGNEVKNIHEFNLNADGTYFEEYDDEFFPLNFTESRAQCAEIFQGELEQGQERYSGNWAYNEEDSTLTVIDFLFEDLLDDISSETFENGELYFEGVTAEIINGQLVLSSNEAGNVFTVYFNRK